RRLGDREHDVAVLDADVVRSEAARDLLLALVVERQIRADHLPALAAVRRHVDELAARVNAVVIVRRDRQRHRPHEAELHVRRREPDGALRPDLYVLRLARAFVVAHHDPAHAPGSGRRRPDDVGIGRVGCRPAALTTSHRMPLTTRDGPSSTAAPPPQAPPPPIPPPPRPGPVPAGPP